MLILGAKGFAKEVLEICSQNGDTIDLAFYDDVNEEIGDKLYNQFPILHSLDHAKKYFESIDKRFTIGIGKPELRKKMVDKFTAIGGVLTSTISKTAEIGHFDVTIGYGANILAGVKISNSVTIGECTLVYYNSIITHDVVIGKYVEISPGATVLGRVQIQDNCQIGAGAIILPDLIIGENTIIGAGSVVTKNIPSNSVVIGVPGKCK
jgi:sugar O-acyltransferase (sialic acid O-acetyltransferase NeuD family)